MTPKQRFDATIQGLPHDRAPVTPLFMQWAAHRVGLSYRDYYLHGANVAKAQVAVALELGTDMVCAISDPWTESSGYGMALEYPERSAGVPRAMRVDGPADVLALPELDPSSGRLAQRVAGVGQMREAVGQSHPVVGWIEGPIAQYSDLRGVESAMMDLLDEPAAFAEAGAYLVAQGLVFARGQIESGADVIGVGDAAASLLSPGLYRELVLPLQQQLIRGLHEAGARVKLHICGDITAILPDVVTTGADIIDLDCQVSIEQARELAGPAVTLAGNFDPASLLLRGTPADVTAAAERCIAAGGERFMLQPGCEVPPGTPVENLRAFCPAGADVV